MSRAEPPDPGSAGTEATDGRVSVIRRILTNNNVNTYDSNATSDYFIDNQQVIDTNGGDIPGDGDGDGDGVGNDDNDVVLPSVKKKAVYMTKRRKIEEKMAEKETKRLLYKAAVEDMENNVYPSYNSCAKHYGLNHSTLKRLHDTGGEYIGHNKSNRVIIN